MQICINDHGKKGLCLNFTLLKHKNKLSLHGGLLTTAMHDHRETIKLTHYVETKKWAHDSESDSQS